MNALSKIPNDLDEFLNWLKSRTETAWADYKTTTLEEFQFNEVGGSSWRTGTKWQTGLTEDEIAALENNWGVKFPKDYRLFLAILNAPDRGMYATGWSDDPPYGLTEEGDEPSYFDWRQDNEALDDALSWPLKGLGFDVEESSLWLPGWGRKPFLQKRALKKLEKLVEAAPPLIPLTGHRYLAAHTLDAGNLVLSVYQSDIICYASDLRNFLLLEFSELLGFEYEEITAIATKGITSDKISEIPFWGEIMLRD